MTVAPVTDGEITDGRVLRGARTRESIVQALLDLLNDGVTTPTAAHIADRAGVSVRSVFQHFADMESLYADLAAEQRVRVAPLLSGLQRPDPLPERIAAIVAQRSELFETITPVRHAIGTRAFDSVALQERLTELATALRQQVAEQFSGELGALTARPRRSLLDALDLLTSFEAWDRLRVVQLLDRADAERTLSDALSSLLD